MSKDMRTHPTEAELATMSNKELRRYALREATALTDQKQTAVPRLLNELVRRLK
jgi:hypothetical protein